ncbi:MAG: TonB-dependent receptor [Bacteroidia bacterium]|nr:TonB-dependent receptor [Bacteroidia bacterium]
MNAFFRILIMAGCLVQVLVLQAHEGAIQGYVRDAATRLPMPQATVTLGEGTQKTYTLENGEFRFRNLPAGTYVLEVARLGYRKVQQEVTVREDESTVVTILLEETSIDLPAIDIQGQADRNLAVLSGLDIRLRPVRSSQDVLRMVPGLFIAQHAGGGKAEQIFLRGFDIDHGTDIRLSVDGMPVNMVSHAHGQGYADLHFVIPEVIDRVEFEKGPYAARQGNMATAGFVDFQTKNGLESNLVKLEAGQYNSFRTLAMFNLLDGTQGQYAYVAAEHRFTDGYFESPQGFNRTNVFAKYHGQLHENTLLSASLSTFTSKWTASGQIPERAVQEGLITRFGALDSTEGGETSRQNLNLQLFTTLANGATVRNQLFLGLYAFELYSNFTFFLEDSVNGDQIRQKESRQLLTYQGAYTQEDQIGHIRFRTEAGIYLRQDAVRDNELSHTVNRRTTLEHLALGTIHETNAALYVDEIITLSPRVTVNAGLRYDQFHFEYTDDLAATFQRQAVTQGVFSPKLNLHLTANSRLRFFVNSGIGFHSNDTRTILAARTREILPRALGVDVGLVAKPVRSILMQAALWGLDMEQEFVYVGDAGIVEPGGETRRAGADLSVRAQLTPWLYADADVNYTLPRTKGVPAEEAYIPLAPLFSSVGGLTLQLGNGLQGSLRYRYLGDRPANEDYSLTAAGYFLADLVLGYSMGPVTVQFSVENLLDAEWKEAQFDTESRLRNETSPISEIHYTPGTPRFAQVQVGWQF